MVERVYMSMCTYYRFVCVCAHALKVMAVLKSVQTQASTVYQTVKSGRKGSRRQRSTLQHCKRFHNLCGIHFIGSLNGHGGRGLAREDEVVIQIFKEPVIVEPVIHLQLI